MELTVKIIKDFKKEMKEDGRIMSGGMDIPLSWEDYKAQYITWFHPHLELLKEIIMEKGLNYETGSSFANHNHFEFSDGIEVGYTWRGWGDLLAAINGDTEEKSYLKYYM